MEKQRPAGMDLPLATGWTRRREGRAQDFYTIESRLGEGGCGSVFGAKRISDGLRVALKLVEKTEWDQFGTPWEVQLMSQVNRNTGHRNILRLYEWFDAPESYVLVLERPEPCRDLSDFCSPQKKMDEQLARVVIQQLLDALLHCQHSGVFHRDLKPANVLINTDTNHVTLIDFGVGTRWSKTPYTSFAGTLAFTPPEWFESGAYQAGPATVWSLGVTLYNLVCGYFPYNALEGAETMGIVWYPEELSPALTGFIKRCLAPEVELRASLEELQHHPWLRPSCVQSDLRSILDQLTPENLEQLVKRVNKLSIKTEAQLGDIAEMVLEKAICEVEFASTYARMCCELKQLTVPGKVSNFPLNFQSIMIDRCQREVVKVLCDGAVLEKEWRDQRAAKGEDRQKLEELEAKVTAHRKRSVSSMKFLGELHKCGMVRDGVILECITELLDTETAEAMECVCRLIATTGPILHSEELQPEMDRIFCRIERILRERSLTARQCFMLQDLLELRPVHTSERERITKDVKLRKAEDPWRPSFGKVKRLHHGQQHDKVRHSRLRHGEHQGLAQDQRYYDGERQGHGQSRRQQNRERQGHAQDLRQRHWECQGHAQDLRQPHWERQGHAQDLRQRHWERQGHAQDLRQRHWERQGHAQDLRQRHWERQGHAQDLRQRHWERQGHAQDLRQRHWERQGHAQDLRQRHWERQGHAQDLRQCHWERQGHAQDLRQRHWEPQGHVQTRGQQHCY